MYRNIVILTGAGISQESGIATFRDSGGIWNNYRVEDVATPQAFKSNPSLVHTFYNERRKELLSGKIKPNPAHIALAEFENKFKGGFLIVTQNVDDLHERAGSTNIIHMHGSLLEARDIETGEVFSWHDDLSVDTPHPKNNSIKGRLRPNIVWFGEIPMHMDKISTSLHKCDLFVAIGTSGVVYPAAGFVQLVPEDCYTVEINVKETTISSLFDENLYGPASQMVPQFFNNLK